MDIVEKLRAGTDDELLAHDLMFDAADEIERLRAIAIENRAEADAAHGYSVEMRHENDLLREALQHLLDMQNGPPLGGRFGEEWQAAVDQARAALGGGQVMRYQDLDIVTRLRNEQDALDTEAADEIERLRKTLQHIAFLDHPYLGSIAKRGSLGKIAQAALGKDKPFEDRWDNA